MKVSIQESLYPNYTDKGTNADSIRSRMSERLAKAKAKQKGRSSKVTPIKKARK